jgi:hypothetical protein
MRFNAGVNALFHTSDLRAERRFWLGTQRMSRSFSFLF